MSHVLEIEIVPITVQEELKQILNSLMSEGELSRIDTDLQFANANKALLAAKEKRNYVTELRENLLAPHKEATTRINDYFRGIVDLDKKNPNGQIDILIKKLEAPMIVFTQEKEAKRIEDQRKIDEEFARQKAASEAEARKKREAEEAQRQEAERKRRESEEAERKRQQAIKDAAAAEQRAKDAKSKAAREKAEKEQREAEAKIKEEQAAKDKADREAAKADQKADKSGAEADNILELSAVSVPQVVQSTAKVKGFSVATNYKPEVVNEIAAKKYCLEKEKYHYLLLDMKVINKMVAAEKLNFVMDGIKVVPDLSARSRA